MRGKKLFEQIGSREYLLYILKEDAHKFNKILALFCIVKMYKFDNYEQLGFFFKRYARSAKRLEAFSLEKIKKTIDYLINTQKDYKIGLETVEKFIMDIDKLCGDEKPIITLKNGEEVYSVERLKELNEAGIIYYKNDKWYELS